MNRWLGRGLALVALVTAGVLLVLDLTPGFMTKTEHTFVAAAALAAIALANLVYHAARQPGLMEMVKALLLSAAFGFWSLNQLLPTLPVAPLFNDLAIALFVLDLTIIVAGRARRSHDI